MSLYPEEQSPDSYLGRHIECLLTARAFESFGSTKWMQLGHTITAARDQLAKELEGKL